MRSRYSTFAILVMWLASWGLIYINGSLFIVPLLPGFVMLGVSLVHDTFARDFGSDLKIIVFPLKRSDEFHNQTTRLERCRHALLEKQNKCSLLISRCKDPHEQMRIPVLEAERDAAAREANRIADDLSRLQFNWVTESDERTYRRLTRGR